jgi:WbqC-like protein family
VLVGVIQSNFVPWRGYFDFIDDVELFIFYDDVKYTKGDWRNRNKIKSQQGLEWLTVPVKFNKLDQLIENTPIDYSQKWQTLHKKKLFQNYSKAEYFSAYIDEFLSIIDNDYSSISELNVVLCKWIMKILEIQTPVKMSHDFCLSGNKTVRLVDLLTQVSATSYLSGPSARAYLDMELFQQHNIRLEYKSYDYLPYPQLWGEFVGEVSVLDLLFNTGPEARKYLKSRSSNRIILP